MRNSRNKNKGFISEDVFRLQLFLFLISLALIFIAGGVWIRVLIVAGVVGFFVFVRWYDWKTTLRPGDKVKIIYGQHIGLRGIVHSEHNPQHKVRVRVIYIQGGEEITQEFSQYDVRKV